MGWFVEQRQHIDHREALGDHFGQVVRQHRR